MHAHMLQGWVAPTPPIRFPELTAVKLQMEYGHRWHLDFSSAETGERRFASDSDECPEIAWPWAQNFDPSDDDWRVIGFCQIVTIQDQSQEIRPLSAQELDIRKFVESLLPGPGYN